MPYFHAVDACNEAIIPIILLEMLNAWPAFFRTIFFFWLLLCERKGENEGRKREKNKKSHILILYSITFVLLFWPLFLTRVKHTYIYRYLYPKGVILTQKLSRYPDVWILSMCENSFFSYLCTNSSINSCYLNCQLYGHLVFNMGIEEFLWLIFPQCSGIFENLSVRKIKEFCNFYFCWLCGVFRMVFKEILYFTYLFIIRILLNS